MRQLVPDREEVTLSPEDGFFAPFCEIMACETGVTGVYGEWIAGHYGDLQFYRDGHFEYRVRCEATIVEPGLDAFQVLARTVDGELISETLTFAIDEDGGATQVFDEPKTAERIEDTDGEIVSIRSWDTGHQAASDAVVEGRYGSLQIEPETQQLIYEVKLETTCGLDSFEILYPEWRELAVFKIDVGGFVRRLEGDTLRAVQTRKPTSRLADTEPIEVLDDLVSAPAVPSLAFSDVSQSLNFEPIDTLDSSPGLPATMNRWIHRLTSWAK